MFRPVSRCELLPPLNHLHICSWLIWASIIVIAHMCQKIRKSVIESEQYVSMSIYGAYVAYMWEFPFNWVIHYSCVIMAFQHRPECICSGLLLCFYLACLFLFLFFSPVKFRLPSAVIYVLLKLHVLEVDLQLMSHMCAAVMSRCKWSSPFDFKMNAARILMSFLTDDRSFLCNFSLVSRSLSVSYEKERKWKDLHLSVQMWVRRAGWKADVTGGEGVKKQRMSSFIWGSEWKKRDQTPLLCLLSRS